MRWLGIHDADGFHPAAPAPRPRFKLHPHQVALMDAVRRGPLVLIAGAALAVGACKADPHPFTAAADLAERQHEENAMAGYMVRLGMNDWTAACAYAVGRDGGARADLKRCTVDFHFTGPISGRP